MPDSLAATLRSVGVPVYPRGRPRKPRSAYGALGDPLTALLFLIFALALLFSKKVLDMSTATDSLAAVISALSAEVEAVSAAVAALKAGQVSPADTAAVEKAVAEVQAATAALKAAIG